MKNLAGFTSYLDCFQETPRNPPGEKKETWSIPSQLNNVYWFKNHRDHVPKDSKRESDSNKNMYEYLWFKNSLLHFLSKKF